LLIIEIKISKEQQSEYNKTDNGITVEIHLVVNDLEPDMFKPDWLSYPCPY
jgi:hypothetical protein